MGRAFSPLALRTLTWGVAPGWDGDAPLAREFRTIGPRQTSLQGILLLNENAISTGAHA